MVYYDIKKLCVVIDKLCVVGDYCIGFWYYKNV